MGIVFDGPDCYVTSRQTIPQPGYLRCDTGEDDAAEACRCDGIW